MTNDKYNKLNWKLETQTRKQENKPGTGPNNRQRQTQGLNIQAGQHEDGGHPAGTNEA